MTTNGNARVLVVDDAPLIRDLMRQTLQSFGYTVDTADNGQQAIDRVLKQPPDLILMDAVMPVLDGVTACSRIKQLPGVQHLPIIIVTAFGEGEWVDRAYAAGATDYVTKPVNWDVLRNRIHYILQAKQAEEALFREKEKAQVTLASIGDGVITTNADGQVAYLNAAATKLTGWPIAQAKGLPLNQVFAIIEENTQQPLEFPIHLCLTEGQAVQLDNPIVLIHRQRKKQFAIEESAAPIKDQRGHIIGVVLVFHDVTENREMTRQLAYQAKHDALTGLYNRHEFLARLRQLLHSPRDQSIHHALLYLDLDQFKIVNDSCGHEAGDKLLKKVAFALQQKLAEQARLFTQATLARLGGDEFALLLENCSLADSQKVANKLCQEIENMKFFWQKDEQKNKNLFTIGMSIGLVPISTQLVTPESVLAMADTACYAAKNAGRNSVYLYQENDHQLSKQEIQWVSLINTNLEKNHGFSLLCQPMLPLKASLENCQEILLRLDNQQGQLVPPGAFLSTATRYHLMPSLDLWVIRTSLNWLKNHPQPPNTLYTINISGHSLNDPQFLETVIQCLEQEPHLICQLGFEINEPTALTQFTEVLHFMTALKKLGCRFILDNFGSGLAAFSYLKNLPVDFLKIDGALVKNMMQDPLEETLVKSINDLAHLMNFQTIAEHVENQAVLDKLTQLQVDYAQGYWMAKPQLLR